MVPVIPINQVLDIILEIMDEGIHVIDQESKTIFYNQMAAYYDGRNIVDVLGIPLLQSFPELTEQSSTLLQVIQTGKPIYHHEQSYVNSHGHTFDTLNTILPIYVNDQLSGAVKIIKDYSGLKTLSERLLDIQSNKENAKLLPLRETLRETEAKLITEALLQTNGNVLQASKLLKIPRQTLQYKIQKYC